MKFWNDPTVVSKTPILTTLLLEGANVGQLWRMWTYHTAAGQSLLAWFEVFAALALWLNFYRVITPDQKFAKWATGFGLCMNAAVWLTVIYFRLTGRG